MMGSDLSCAVSSRDITVTGQLGSRPVMGRAMDLDISENSSILGPIPTP